MTIEQTDVIDFLAHDPKSDEIWLVITDHLDWSEDDDFDKLHMSLLKEKLNAYIDSVDSGAIYESHPEARHRRIGIRIMAKYPMSAKAQKFFENAKLIVKSMGLDLVFDRRG